jgi:hypothetical protein
MKTKKVVDWIKFNNLKEQTRNYSALKGLGRINGIFKFLFRLTLGSTIIYYPLKAFLNDVENVLKNEPTNFYKRLDQIPNKEKIFHNAHIKSIIAYSNEEEFEKKEIELGIYDYRKKLLNHANGLVLETSCGLFRNKIFYPESVSNVIKINLDYCYRLVLEYPGYSYDKKINTKCQICRNG